MDTQALRWFQQVADGATVTEVGEIEQVSQSGVSRALARLEREVGAPLLRRSGRHLRMTHAGSVFKRHVDAVLHQLDDGLAAVDEAVQPDTGTVTLGFQTTLGAWLVPDLVRGFRRSHPRVRFELTQAPDHLVDTLLDSGHVDLVLSTVAPSSPAVRRQVLLTEPLRLAVPAEHPLAGRGSVRLVEAAAEPFLLLRAPALLRRQTERLCQAAGFRPSVAFEGDDVATLHGFVAAGLGVALLPGSPWRAAGVDGPDVRYLPVEDPGASRDVGLASPADSALPPAARLFLAHVLDRALAGGLPGAAPGGRRVGAAGAQAAGGMSSTEV